MNRVRIKWKMAGFRQLRRSEFALAEVQLRAERIADACGEGYVARSSVGRARARAAVITATARAMNSNAKHNTILRNLDAAR